jgi:hypothetical protein
MSRNVIPNKPEALKTIALNLVSGLEKHGVEIGVKRDPAVLSQASEEVTAVQTRFQTTISHRTTVLSPAQKAADQEMKAFLGNATKLFRSQLGERWNQGWLERGFASNSTAVPKSREARERLVESILNYLKQNPQSASADLGVTVQRAETVLASFTQAKAAIMASKVEQGLIGQERAKAIRRLQSRIRGTIDDIYAELDADSPLWSSFGVHAPVRATSKEVQAKVDRAAEKEQRAVERLANAAERKKKAIDEKLAKATAKANQRANAVAVSSAERSAEGRVPAAGNVASANGSGGADVALPR